LSFGRFDRTLQNIVNKIFGALIEQDLRTEAEFYRQRGMIAEGVLHDIFLLSWC
jgi:hypothetical protein